MGDRPQGRPKNRAKMVIQQVVPGEKGDEMEVQVHGESVEISPRGAGSPRSAEVALKMNEETGQPAEGAVRVESYQLEIPDCQGTVQNPCERWNKYCACSNESLKQEKTPYLRTVDPQ